MTGIGALSATLQLASADAERAEDAIRSLPPGPWRNRLAKLARTIVRREK